ncbi:zinc-dependent alcohol dehydrogenase [Paenibacillus lignilyticus]|uniref:Alcohol dehydrogenase catalytic domain-containing protein n=1 Tax=Paenibacillus lignilyticus TaxID=1172615 RepID=A0ABS5C8V7_9BACL|nr:alcohol dehydrogenase catalytic domain-containing protein [Paenibacillus lignilyticus]MBP3962432.1 alcohol dehydrogenase catalytic domain-containing protein [Paenibacillus lignilyticus]
MKAIQITGVHQYESIEVPVPEIKDDQVLVRIHLVATCPRWDLHMMGGKDMFIQNRQPDYPLPPGFPGHEAVGVVEAVGSSVQGFAPGDRVVALEHVSPGFGAYAQFMAYRENDLLKLPDHISDKRAVSSELLKCVMYGLDQFDELQGKTLLVAGLGPAGILAMQLASLWGAKVTAIDVNRERVEYIKGLSLQGEAVHADDLGDRRFDLGYDCVGYSASVQNVLDRTDEHVIIFGVLKGNITYPESYWYKGTRLESYRYHPVTKRDRHLLLDALSNPAFNTECLQTEELSFKEYKRGVELLKAQKAIKICFNVQEDF